MVTRSVNPFVCHVNDVFFYCICPKRGLKISTVVEMFHFYSSPLTVMTDGRFHECKSSFEIPFECEYLRKENCARGEVSTWCLPSPSPSHTPFPFVRDARKLKSVKTQINSIEYIFSVNFGTLKGIILRTK